MTVYMLKHGEEQRILYVERLVVAWLLPIMV